MKENQKQRHQQKNKPNQQEHRKIDQNHDKKKLKYLLHKKSSIIKMIESDLLKGKSKKYQTIVLVFLKMYQQAPRIQRQIYPDRFVTLTKIAHFGPSGAKLAFCGLASLALRFQWFQRNFVDFGNTVFCQNGARHQKTQK